MRKDRCSTAPRKITAAKRRIEAMQLRQEGLDYREIGRRMGCSSQRAHAIVQEQFARLRAEQNELAEDILRLTNDRIEQLMKVHWQNALKGDRFANEMLLKLIDRQARLFGVDAPKKTENKIEVSTNDPEQLRARARMMGVDVTDLETPADGKVEGGPAKGQLPPGPSGGAEDGGG